jgi:hypothetical protein
MTDRTPDTHDLALALSRIVDRTDGERDWHALERDADPEARRRELARALREESRLRAAGGELAASAASVALPPLLAGHARLWRLSVKPLLATAALFLAWVVATRPVEPPRDGEPAPSGREQLGELVPVVVDRRAIGEDGEHELILLRQILEREVVPALYEVGVDEHEGPVTRPVQDTGPSVGSYL